MAYHSGGVGEDNLAVRLPPHLQLVLDIGHIGGYYLIKQMFEFLAILTSCLNLSKYCHGKKILLRFYYDIRSGIVIKGGHGIMSKNEIELIKLIRENDKPEMVASYMFNLFLDYLRTNGPSQEKHAADLPVSV